MSEFVFLRYSSVIRLVEHLCMWSICEAEDFSEFEFHVYVRGYSLIVMMQVLCKVKQFFFK